MPSVTFLLSQPPKVCVLIPLLVLPTKARDIVFIFIIEYSSLRAFPPLGNNRSIFIGGFLKDDILACVEN